MNIMNTFFAKVSPFIALAVLALSLGSCTSSTSTSTPTPNGTSPGVGSSYNFILSQADSVGNPVAADQSEVATVQTNTLTYKNVSNVTAENFQAGTSSVVQYYAFPSTGDVMQYATLASMNGAPLRSAWLNYPFQSAAGGTVSFDTIFIDPQTNRPDTIHFTAIFTHRGTDNVTIGSQQVSVQTCTVRQFGTLPSIFGRQDFDVRSTYYYAPSLKQVVKSVQDQTSFDKIFGYKRVVYTTSCVSYTLKN